MNILISCGFLNYELDANTKIVSSIAQKLTDLGHTVSLVGECLEMPNKQASDMQGAIRHYRLFLSPFVQKASDKLEKYIGLPQFNNDRNLAKRKFMRTHLFSSAILAYRYSSLFTNEKRMNKYAAKVLALSKTTKTDCIICVYSPFQYAKPIFNIANSFSCPLYIWQLDPWGLHCFSGIDTGVTDSQRIMHETAIFERAKHIFTTAILKKQYLNNTQYAKFNSKLTALEFPNITDINSKLSGNSVCDFKSDCINLAFCGLISDIYRSPKYLLDAFYELIKHGVKFKAVFVGGKKSKALDEYLEKFPNYIQHYAAVSVENAFATMKKADVLINIGNKFNNQVPSKIFDYFALGKPVLNVQKIDDCPAIEYFKRYTLAYTICETDEKLDVQGLMDFLKSAKGKSIEFAQVQKAFADCTPEYVAQKISDTISM